MTKLSIVGVAALALLGTAPAAFAVAPNPVFSETVPSLANLTQEFTIVVTRAGTYDEMFSWSGLAKMGGLVSPTTLTLSFQLNGPGSVTNVSSEAIAYNNTTKLGGSVDYGLFTLAKGTYTVDITAGKNLSASNVNYKLTGVNVSPVPGPVTGAGLSVLMSLIGFGAWMRRKRVF